MATYRYFRFHGGWCRDGSHTDIQLSEWALLNGSTRLTGMTATCNGTTGTGEEADKAADNSTATKWLQLGPARDAWLQYDFGSAVTATGYRWATANDNIGKDPISWYVEGSDDATSWTRLDTQNRYATTTTRTTFLPDFTFTTQAVPVAVSGCAAWWRADQIAGQFGISTAVDGDAVDPWPDASGAGRDATQGTSGSRPTLQVGEINGLPVVRFDGVDDYLESTASASFPQQTVFAVVRPSAVGGGSTHAIRASSSAGGLEFRLDPTAKMNLVKQGIAEIASATTAYTVNTVHVLTASYTDGGTYAFYFDGAADGSGSHGQTLNSGTTTLLGRYHDGGELWAGDIAEVIVYSRVLSEGERAQVHTYLSDKYAITVADYTAANSALVVPVQVRLQGRARF